MIIRVHGVLRGGSKRAENAIDGSVWLTLHIPADLLEDGRCDTFDAPPFGRFVQLDPAAFHFCPSVQHFEEQVG